jgi:hypothetical protein
MAWQGSQDIPGTRRFITAFRVSENIIYSELVETNLHPHPHFFKIHYNVTLPFIKIQIFGLNLANFSWVDVLFLALNRLFYTVIVIVIVFYIVIISRQCKILKQLDDALKLRVLKRLIYLNSNNFLHQYRNYPGIFFIR